MSYITIVLICIIIVGIIGIIYAYSYNKLVDYKVKIEKSESIVDEALRKKYDLIVKMNSTIKKVVTKQDYLKEYVDLKNIRISNFELDRKLSEAVNVILELKHDHSKLNTKDFNKDVDELTNIDEELLSGKNYFNKNTAALNELVQKFPTNIVAKIHRYKIKPFFDGKNMQDAVLDDFKL